MFVDVVTVELDLTVLVKKDVLMSCIWGKILEVDSVHWYRSDNNGNNVQVASLKDGVTAFQEPYKDKFQSVDTTAVSHSIKLLNSAASDAGMYWCNVTHLTGSLSSDKKNLKIVVSGNFHT